MGHSCCAHHDHAIADAGRRTDPTGTTTIRKRFEGDVTRRFRRLKGLINQALIQNDVLGLKRQTVGDQAQSGIVRIMRDEAPQPGAFAFNRSGEKVSGFMGWLRQQQEEGILGVLPGTPMERAAETAWTNTYIESSYQKGIRDAGAKLRAAGANVAPSWVQNAFTRPIHADRVGLAFTRTFSELQGITQTMDQQISRVLAQGLAEGQNPMQISRNINNRVDKVGITRARTLARTEVIAAHAEASLNSYEEAGVQGVEVEAEFSTAGDALVCEECEALEGRMFELSESHGIIPVHPNCLPGDSLVLSRTGISAATKRWFDGNMVVIKTASGRELTCTPNHPVLTDRGWTPAERVNLSSDVICDGGSEWVVGIDGNNQDIPSRIHDVAESFFRSREVSTTPVPVSPEHFHGDGKGSKIAIVGTDGLLRDNPGNAPAFQLRKNKSLKVGHSRKSLFFPFGAPTKIVVRSLHAAHCIVRKAYLVATILTAHLLPFKPLRLALSSSADAGAFEDHGNAPPTKWHAVGNTFFRFSAGVCSNNLVRKALNKLRSTHVVAPQKADNHLVGDAELASKLASGRAYSVFSDKVVSVNKFAFSGHVYNLETGEGWYSANGIITHNCRCAFIPVVTNGTGITLQ